MRTYIQSEAAECGIVCLAIASAALGAPVELADLRRRYPISTRGLSLSEIVQVAAGLELSTRAVRCEIEELKDLSLPAILHWGMNHFVVLTKVRSSSIIIDDPATGRRLVSIADASTHFTGVALEVTAAPAFQRRKARSPLSIWSLIKWTKALRAGLIQTLLLSLMVQVYVLLSPFYMQLAIDEAALKGDQGLLGALAVGFGLFALFNVGAEALRGIALQRVSALVSWDMTVRLYRHLIRLPLPWFQRRRLADTLSRFDSIQPIRAIVSNGLVASLIDGLLACTTLLMMMVLAWPLAAIAAVGAAAYIALKVATVSTAMRTGSAALAAMIAEEGKRIETLRAIQTIKAMGAEVERETNWANQNASLIKATQTDAQVQIAIRAAQGAIEAAVYVSIIYFGAKMAMTQAITIGTLFAFMSYRQQFLARSTGLIDALLNWRLLDIHSDRLADIVLTPIEERIDAAAVDLPDTGSISVRNLGFSYSTFDKAVLRNVSFDVRPGEYVAITGPSGGGKSTILKLIAGLYPPTMGEVLLDGRPLKTWAPKAVRQCVVSVLQDDELLSGSISENVAFFDPHIDLALVKKCLSDVGLLDEVMSMPMRTETYIGDMGGSLSGGQKQRLLLARALYRRPKILLLDEATSHLDIENERIVNEALQRLSITRIVVAHRPDTIASADRAIRIESGTLRQDGGGKLDIAALISKMAATGASQKGVVG